MASPLALQTLLKTLDPVYYTEARVKTLSNNDMIYAIKQMGAEDSIALLGTLETKPIVVTRVATELANRQVIQVVPGFGGSGGSGSTEVISVKDASYGALGNNTGNDATAINAAITAGRAAYDATGSMQIVYFPPGTYRCTATINQRFGVRLVGPGRIFFPIDLGVGTFGLSIAAMVGGDGYPNAPSVEGLTILGPVTAIAIGVQGCNMDGIDVAQSSTISQVYVSKFRAGLRIARDHNTFREVTSIQNYWNVLYDNSPSSRANHQFFGCFLHNAAHSSIAINGGNMMDQTAMVGCQLGYSPYGIYKFGAAATLGMMNDSVLTDTSFEGCGNAFIYDSRTDGTNDSISYSTFVRCYGADSSASTTYRIAADLPIVAGINVRGLRSVRFEEAASRPLTALSGGGATQQINVRSLCQQVDIKNGPLNTGSGIYLTNGIGILGAVRLEGGNSIERYRAESHYAFGTILAGDLLAWSTSGNGVVRAPTGGGQFVGIAMNDAALGTNVMVAPAGSQVNLNAADGTAGVAIRSLVGTEHNGTATGANPVIATAIGSVSAGKLLCRIRGG